MAFMIRYQDATGGMVDVTLDPAPAEVEYPDAQAVKVTASKDGNVIVQRPLRDSRPRKWRWVGYGPPHPAFAALWALLESLNARARAKAGLPVTVGIWEDVSGSGGFNRVDGAGGKVYTTVKLVQVNRTPDGSGPVFYESSAEFYIADDTCSTF
jgi:hypothetical protein